MPIDRTGAVPGTIQIALIRLPATEPSKRIGSLLVNPGGPGGSGVELVKDAGTQLFSKELRARFDIIGFDPRGVNASAPIRCVDDLDHFLALDSTPDTDREWTTLLAGEQDFADGCARRNGPLLAHVGTADVVEDLDTIRAALGDAKITYIGFSYGTLIGALYAQMHPDRIRALALDGAVDPTLDEPSFRHAEAIAFEASFDRFLAACASSPRCVFRHDGHPGPAFDALMARIEETPLENRIDPRRLVGPSLAWSAVASAMYDERVWPVLEAALAQAERGDGTLLLAMSDPFQGRKSNGAYSNLVDANAAVICLDFPGPSTVDGYRDRVASWQKDAPRFGALLALTDLGCADWPIKPDRVPAAVSAPGSPPIVVVGTKGDPATPYAWAQALHRQLTSSDLVTFAGGGHTAYGRSTCVTDAVDAYLLELTTPKAGLVCED